MGRHPEGENPKTARERQEQRRQNLKEAHLFPMLVRGKNGFWDERIRLALGVRELARKGVLSEDVIVKLVSEAVEAQPVKDRIAREYLRRLIQDFLAE